MSMESRVDRWLRSKAQGLANRKDTARRIGWWCMTAVVFLFLFGVVAFCSGQATAHDGDGIVLAPESVEEVAAALEGAVARQAALFNQLTAKDWFTESWQHFATTTLSVIAALFQATLALAVLIGLSYIGGLRSLGQVRDAIDEWREISVQNPVLSGFILVAGSIVAGSMVVGYYVFLAHASTPHG